MAESQVAVHAENSTENSGKVVGFKPGNIYRFRKGLSGNPGGRPRKVLSDELERALETIIPHDREGENLRRKFHLGRNARWKHAIAAGMVRRAVESTEAAQELANRVEGKVTQPILLDTPVDVQIRVIYVRGDDEKP